MGNISRLFCLLIFVFLVECQLYLPWTDAVPIKFNGLPRGPNEKNGRYQDSGYSLRVSVVKKNESAIKAMKTKKKEDIAYGITKRNAKWNLENVEL